MVNPRHLARGALSYSASNLQRPHLRLQAPKYFLFI